ncbi:MAG TPA: thioredoxin domain-containing protein [Myxococcaceae bacterium]|nr:thioredoxin domain-containing protein [Myxococcaceae bacterium]
MSADVMEVTDEGFAREVVSAQLPVVVDFSATRCGPCRALEPIVEELAASYRGRIAFRTVNVDDHQQAAQQYGVRATPTLLLFKGGKVVGQLVGMAPGMRARLDGALQQLL